MLLSLGLHYASTSLCADYSTFKYLNFILWCMILSFTVMLHHIGILKEILIFHICRWYYYVEVFRYIFKLVLQSLENISIFKRQHIKKFHRIPLKFLSSRFAFFCFAESESARWVWLLHATFLLLLLQPVHIHSWTKDSSICFRVCRFWAVSIQSFSAIICMSSCHLFWSLPIPLLCSHGLHLVHSLDILCPYCVVSDMPLLPYIRSVIHWTYLARIWTKLIICKCWLY